jgi:hypothetical protein
MRHLVTHRRRVEAVTREDQQSDSFAARMAFALRKDPAEDAYRTHLHLKIVAVTLAWLVLVPLLLIYGVTTHHSGDEIFDVAAFATILGPFIAAVMATKNHRTGIGGAYVVLTLLMALPAVAIARF